MIRKKIVNDLRLKFLKLYKNLIIVFFLQKIYI